MRPKILSAHEAVALIPDGATVAIGGGGAGHNVPDALLEALGERFATTAHPRGLTTIHPCGLGDNDQRGLNYLAQEGLIRRDIGGFWGNAPKMVQLAQAHKLEGYNLPQGVLSHLMRATAGGQPGVVTRTGLHTFVDPRKEGGKINSITTEDIVKVIQIEGEEYLFYKAFPIDVAIIRGSTSDAEGNITMEEEVGTFAMLSMAQAARCNRGLVIAQVKQIRKDKPALPVQVKVPGVLIDVLVVAPEQTMTFLTDHDPALIRRDAPFRDEDLYPEGVAQVVAKRAACELYPGAYVNLGYGMADGVPLVARQEGVLHSLIFLIEQGATAGIPTTGLNFGAMYNPAAILDDGYQFDFFQGGGLDLAFLGFAQIDQHGNVNSSRFADRITGCGGAIDISQNARKVVFCGTFAAKANVTLEGGKLNVADRGRLKKFVPRVEQITFNGRYAFSRGQEVLYCTERAIFRLTEAGIELTEIAPGVDLEKDILEVMDFRPGISANLRTMNRALFTGERIGLQERFLTQRT